MYCARRKKPLVCVHQAWTASGSAARGCYFLPEWRQRGCSLVNCGGRLDASRLHYWPVLSLESSSRPAEGKCYWFCPFLFFLILYLFVLFSPIETDQPADLEWLAKDQLRRNCSFSIWRQFLGYYRECWTQTASSVCERSCSHMCDCEGRIRESAGNTNPSPAIWESHGFVVSFRRCSCNPTLSWSQVKPLPLPPPPSGC